MSRIADLNHNVRNPLAIIKGQITLNEDFIPPSFIQIVSKACERIEKAVYDHTSVELAQIKGLFKAHDEFEFNFYHESGIKGAPDFEVGVHCSMDRDGAVTLLRVYKGSVDITEIVQNTDAWNPITERAQEIALERIDSAAS